MRRLPSPRRGRSLERGERRGDSRDSTPTRDEGYTPTPAVKKPRCRDYDEKGYCLRGDLCKFDHGTDAVVLDGDSNKEALGYQPGPPTQTGTEPYIPGLPTTAGIPFPPPGLPVMTVPPPGYPPQYGAKRAHDGDGTGGFEPPAKRFDYQRLGRGRGRGRGGFRGGRGGASTMLAVRNIPAELNTITHLNGHFSRYGNLVNVQVQFEGDLGSALVTFSSTDEATAAFSSSEAVMNNRFIKVFWHMDKGHVKDRLGSVTNPNMVLVHGDRITKTVPNEAAGGTESTETEDENSEKAKEDKEKAIMAIQKNQEMLQVYIFIIFL
jgi:RNA-binding protein 26